MGFLLTKPVRRKIVVEDQVNEQENTSIYLGCGISFECVRDCENKNNKFGHDFGEISRKFSIMD